jgi:hypothetical protein
MGENWEAAIFALMLMQNGGMRYHFSALRQPTHPTLDALIGKDSEQDFGYDLYFAHAQLSSLSYSRRLLFFHNQVGWAMLFCPP